jgi:hypothetical protein
LSLRGDNVEQRALWRESLVHASQKCLGSRGSFSLRLSGDGIAFGSRGQVCGCALVSFSFHGSLACFDSS